VRSRRALARVGVAGLLALLLVLSVGAVHRVRDELRVSRVWAAVEAADWQQVLALTRGLEGTALASDPGRRMAEARCWALLAQHRRDACAALMDLAIGEPAAMHEGWLPGDPLFIRLALEARREAGALDSARWLASAATRAHPRDWRLLDLEIQTRSALEDEAEVLAEFDRRIRAATSSDAARAFALRIAAAAASGRRDDWSAALARLGETAPADAEQVAPWFEQRTRALAALGRLEAVRVAFAAWQARGGDPAELRARLALRLSTSQLYDPEHPWVETLRAAIAEADGGRAPRLQAQLYERLIAHLLADGDDEQALAAFDEAHAAGLELRGITRDQLERGVVLQRVGGDATRAPSGRIVFVLPPGLRGGELRVSDHARSEPDAPYGAEPIAGRARIVLERPVAAWPERWVVRDAAGAVRGSGTVWVRPASTTTVEVAVRPASPRPPAAAMTRRPPDGRTRVLALVLDCADWRLAGYLLERGELPGLRSLFERGRRAVLTSDPPLTAAAMESLVWPARGPADSIVGVVHQLGVELAGLASVGRNPFAFLAPLLPESESLFEAVGSGPRVAANMLFTHGAIDAGRHAESVGPHGRHAMVARARARRPLRPDERRRFAGLDAHVEARGHIEAIAAELDAAREIVDAGDVDLLALRLESLDILTHALYSELAATRQDDGVSNLLAAYRYIDARIATIERALDEDDVLVVMSDHGIRTAMEHERDAIFVAAGAPVVPGRSPGRPDLRGVASVLARWLGTERDWPRTGVLGERAQRAEAERTAGEGS